MDANPAHTMSQTFAENAMKRFPSASHANPPQHVKTACLATLSQARPVLLVIASWTHAFRAKTALSATSAWTGITWMGQQRNVSDVQLLDALNATAYQCVPNALKMITT
jgi:hypothetical protein